MSTNTGWPPQNGTVNAVDFSGFCSDQQLSFFTLLDRASFPQYNKHQYHQIWLRTFYFMSNFLWTVIFRILPDFQSSEARLMAASAANTKFNQHSTSYKEISVPMTCLDCKSLLDNTQITEHNTRSIYGRPKLSLIVPPNSGNRANSENDSP